MQIRRSVVNAGLAQEKPRIKKCPDGENSITHAFVSQGLVENDACKSIGVVKYTMNLVRMPLELLIVQAVVVQYIESTSAIPIMWNIGR